VSLTSDSGQKPETRSKSDRVLLHGIAWTTSAKWISQIISWGITLVVARLLSPSDYGLIGMATLALGLVTLFSEFGLGTTVVTLRDTANAHISQLNTISILMGLLGLILAFGIANPASKFFKVPNLKSVIIVMGLSFLISSFRTIPSALLQREMRFKALAIIDALQTVVAAVVTLALAVAGFGYWSLVLGNLCLTIAATGMTAFCKRQRFAWPNYPEIRAPLLFSWHIIVGRLSWFVYDNSDFTIAGKLLGEAPLGDYTLAWTLAHAPLEKLTVLVNRVTPSFFASIQSDFSALRRYLLSITGGLALVIYPVTVGLSLISADLISVALGSKWQGAVAPLQLLAFHALLRSNVILLTPVINAIGEARFAMWQNLASLLILPISFYGGASRWGAVGIASVWVIVFPALQIPLYWRVFRRIQMPTWQYLKSIWPATSACLVMVAMDVSLRWARARIQPMYLELAIRIVIDGAVYVSVLVLAHRPTVNALLRLVKDFRRKSS
jgi:teichuronic acid exporter